MKQKRRRQKLVITYKNGEVYLNGYVSQDVFDRAKGKYMKKEYNKSFYRKLRNFLHALKTDKGGVMSEAREEFEYRADGVIGHIVGSQSAAGVDVIKLIEGGRVC